MNQMYIWTNGIVRTIAAEALRSAAWSAFVTPFGSPGFVSKPYSVIQIGVDLRPNHWLRWSSKVGSCVRLTFGKRTFCFGPKPSAEYGWCDHASNFSFGLTVESSCAKVPGASDSWSPGLPSTWPCPRGDVSPMPIFAFGLPALMPAYPARYSVA